MSPRSKPESEESRRRSSSKQRSQKRPRKRSKKPELPPSLRRVNLSAAGIDIGASAHYVAVPEDRDPSHVRQFGVFTCDLHAIADWLESCEIETVVMESTGVYWIPLMQVLEERGFEALLVDPHKVKNVPGRKSDVLDCQWLQELHTYGLLSGAFRPENEICVLRAYMRQRDRHIERRSEHVQHMQKALREMNIQLPEVLKDITGATGMRIIRSILAGERDPENLASHRDHRCGKSEAAFVEALRGDWREEHLFALSQALELYETFQRQIEACDQQIQAHCSTLPSHRADFDPALLPEKPGRKKSNASTPFNFDAGTELIRITGVDLTRIPGIEAPTAMKIVSEIGVDMTKWRNEKAFAAWLSLCPGNKVSGGKRLSSRTRPSANRAAAAFRLAAYGLTNSDSYLGGFYRRKRAKLGPSKAITAAAHKLARVVYAMLRDGTEYVEKGQDYYEAQYRRRTVRNLKRSAKKLGYQLVPLGEEVAQAS